MRSSWKAALPALALTIVLSPEGSGEEPPRLGAYATQLDASTPHLGTAIAEQRNLASARPDDPGVWNDLGNLLAASGSLDEAESAYARSLELDPGNVQALFNLGLLRQQRGDLAGAVVEYTDLLAIEPGHAWAQYQLGAAYDALGERELAVAHYAEAFTLDPELLFAEKNPHVIENQHVTEALLRARRGSRAAPRAPRAYDEEARINSILTPPLVLTNRAQPETPDEATATDAPNTASTHRDQIGRGAAPRGQTVPSGTEVATRKERVLDSGDLRGSVNNQVRGNADAEAPAAPNTRRRSAATVTPQSRSRALAQPPADSGANAFGVGQRSTGSLEWKLGPASDEPTPAR